MQLFATIKKSSKYFYQGLDEETGKPMLFEIEEIRNDLHAFVLNSNNYRSEDLNFYVKMPCGQLIKLHR